MYQPLRQSLIIVTYSNDYLRSKSLERGTPSMARLPSRMNSWYRILTNIKYKSTCCVPKPDTSLTKTVGNQNGNICLVALLGGTSDAIVKSAIIVLEEPMMKCLFIN